MTHLDGRLAAGEWRTAPGLYVERGGDPVTRHPFDARDARLMIFALPCDGQRLQRLCDRTFAAPTGGAETYVPLGESVYVAFASIAELRSSEPPDDALGSVAEREVGRLGPGVRHPPRPDGMGDPVHLRGRPRAAAGRTGDLRLPEAARRTSPCRPTGRPSSCGPTASTASRPTARVEQRTVLRATLPDGASADTSPDRRRHGSSGSPRRDRRMAGGGGRAAVPGGRPAARPARPRRGAGRPAQAVPRRGRSLPGLLPGRHRGRATPAGPVRRRVARGRVAARRRRSGRAAARA